MNAPTAVAEAQALAHDEIFPPAASLPAVVQDRQPRVTPADLLNLAMQSGDKDIDRLERLMQMDFRYREMQEVDRQRAAEIAFEADFVGFTGEAVIIPKTKEVDRGKAGTFMQAEFDEVCRRLKPALAKHGFGFRHKETYGARPIPDADGVETHVPWVWVVCILSHRGGHKDTLELDGPADAQTANTPTQNAQSTASYMKRQSLLALTGTATGGEDNENRGGGEGRGAAAATDGASRADGTLPAFADDAFKAKLNEWRGMVRSGKKTAEQLLAMLSTRNTLTNLQKATIRGFENFSGEAA